MNLTEVNKKNYIKQNEQNIIIPWDDPYPNITATLSEEQQKFLINLNLIDAKRGWFSFVAKLNDKLFIKKKSRIK